MNDDRLRELLTDAVSDIEPDDRIEELRASVRPAPRVVRHFHARPWYAAAAIVAGVIGVVAYVTSVAGDKDTEPGFATHGGSTPPSMIATDTAAPSPSSAPSATRLTAYYLGRGAAGNVLFRESVPAGDDPLQAAVTALMTSPSDPDYRTAWLAGSIVSARLKHGVVEVELGVMPARRPHGMSDQRADEIVQQAVYTLHAASGHRGAEVQFLRHRHPAHTVLGVPTAHPLAPRGAADVLSPISIGSPTEGQTLGRGRFVVTGMSNAPEGRVVIQVVRTSPTGDTIVLTQSGTASGSGNPDRLYPWRVPIDTSYLPSGGYTLVASDQDSSGGTGGQSPATDTRTIVLR
jgi:hypothetical protein